MSYSAGAKKVATMKMPHMLLVCSTARNTGKTFFSVSFIERWKSSVDIVAIKVTTVSDSEKVCHHGADGCGACSSFKGNYEIIEETESFGKKDTNMLLAAGAKKVYWIKTMKDYAFEAFDSIDIPAGSFIVCESNALSKHVIPGALVLMHKTGVEDIKSSAEALLKNADFVCDIAKPHSVDNVLGKLNISHKNGQIRIGSL
ncbi:MAG: hypothetical protein FWC66_02035 [Oscillospiraceae bacterium]|nr:hypothetical protein [Oscillospiraceae bacterium]